MPKTKKSREDEFIHSGGRNLLLLCLFSVIIATITTCVSVYIYHATGDITGVYEYGCKLFRKRMECAIMIKAAEAEM